MRNLTLAGCLFLSGFAALVYEVVWIRKATLVFGSTTLATSTVVAVFFLGLAVGSLLSGLASRRLARPLRLYALIEIGVGVLALVSPLAFDQVERLYAEAYRAIGTQAPLFLLVRVALVGLVLLPPTVLMGATLPLFAQHATRHPGRIAASVGTLYALNTLGAAVGCAITGLLLIPGVGLGMAIRIGAAANLVAALLAWSLPAPIAAVAAKPRAPAAPPGVVAWLFFLTGFVALANEVLWTRYLGLILRNTVYTYTLTLTVVLMGIVIGSFVAAALFDRRVPLARAFGLLQILIGLYVLTLLFLPPAAWGALGPGLAVRFAMFLPPAVLSGALFPLAVRMVLTQPSLAGLEVGRMSAANIAGGILGSLAVGFVGLPVLGLEASTRIISVLSLAGGVVAWAAFARPGARPRELLYASPAVILWLWVPFALHTRIPADFLHGDSALVAVREGMTSNVAVNRVDGVLQLKIDRWWQGENRRSHQIMAAYVPLAVHPAPRRVLVVGAGAGQTASRFLLGGVEKLDCVDIEPAVFDLIRTHFDTGWLADPRVRLVRDDGRNFVTCTAERYDVISLELGQIFRPGVASFYTADFYAHARARLQPGGIVCQFVPLRFLGTDQFPDVVRTFLATFPHAILWYNTAEVMLLGSADRPLRIHRAWLEALLAEPRIHADLSWSPWGGRDQWLAQPHVFLAGMLCTERGLESLARGAALCRDDRPALEYAAARMDDAQAVELPLVDLLARTLEPVSTVLGAPPSAELAALVSNARSRNLADLRCGAFLKVGQEAQATRGYAGMVGTLDQALQQNPESRIAHRMMGDVLVRLGRISEARPHYDQALRLDPEDPLSLRGLGDWYLVQNQVSEALEIYRRVLAILPDDAQTHNNLGSCLVQLGDATAAVTHFREALRLLPGAADPRRNLELLGVSETAPNRR